VSTSGELSPMDSIRKRNRAAFFSLEKARAKLMVS